jgi:Ser/Thr protein kinase RdoA (MazF antagonist)
LFVLGLRIGMIGGVGVSMSRFLMLRSSTSHTRASRSAVTAALLAPHAREALEAFGVRPARIALVSCSENVTFRVETASPEETFALRLHRSGYNTLGELLSERMWTRALREAGIQTPEDMTAPDGASFVAVGSGHETARLAGLTRWIHGDLLATRIERAAGPGDTLEALRGLGALTARLHDQTRAWRPPEGFSRRSLEVETLLSERTCCKQRRLRAAEACALIGRTAAASLKSWAIDSGTSGGAGGLAASRGKAMIVSP